MTRHEREALDKIAREIAFSEEVIDLARKHGLVGKAPGRPRSIPNNRKTSDDDGQVE